MHTSQRRHVADMAWLVLACCLLLSPVHAAITDADGRVETSVRQLNASTGELLDQAFEETPGTTNVLPAIATASLDIVVQNTVQGSLTSTATVNPPTQTTIQNTKDFSLEAQGLSLPSDRGFACNAKSTENRQIVLSASELDLAAGTRIRVRSTFVLSAGVFLVTLPDSAADIDGTITFTLRQQDSQGSRDLLAGTARVFFDASGQLQISTSGDASQVIAVPFDFAGQSSKIDRARLVLFPLISIPYEYDATVDESFTLTAQVEGNVNAPTGAQGGSAFIGQVPSAFIAALNDRLQVDFGGEVGGAAGSSSQGAAGLAASEMQIIPLLSPSRCGGFGLESLLGGLVLTMACVVRRNG